MTTSLILAEEHIASAIGHLVAFAEHADPEAQEHAKAIAVRLRSEANNIYALRAYVGGVNLTDALERALGGNAGEVCS